MYVPVQPHAVLVELTELLYDPEGEVSSLLQIRHLLIAPPQVFREEYEFIMEVLEGSFMRSFHDKMEQTTLDNINDA